MATKTITLPAWEHADQKKPGVHNALHHAARDMAGMAMVCVALAGMELANKRANTPHGEWLPWVKSNCDYSDETARNYIKVWLATKDRMAKFQNALEFEKLLKVAPSEMSAKERSALGAFVARTLHGTELIEIYRELGIAQQAQGNLDPPKRLPGQGAAKDIDWTARSVDECRFVQTTFDQLLEAPSKDERILKKTGKSRLEAYARLLPLSGEGVTLREMVQRASAAATTLEAVWRERIEAGEEEVEVAV